MSNLGKKPTDDDEVEKLLQAAQDDMLLKLSLNSHMARASASAAIDPDLDSRFLALKKPQKPTKTDNSTRRAATRTDTGDNKGDSGGAAAEDDLFARFAALKNSLPSHSRKETKSSDESFDHQATEEENEDEVEKVIQWAIDAARLDPSPPSDDDDDDARNDSEDDDNDGNGGDHGVGSGKKGRRK